MAQHGEVRRLGATDVGLIGSIDRSEHIDFEYTVRDGELVERPASWVEIPPWEQAGAGAWSVAHQVAFCQPLVDRGATLFGAFDDEELLGLAIVDRSFESPLAWLAYLHVSRPHRGRGVGSLLWATAAAAATSAGATAMYVSAVPTNTAVQFYLSRGCELADPVHPELYALEPDDIHLVCPLG